MNNELIKYIESLRKKGQLFLNFQAIVLLVLAVVASSQAFYFNPWFYSGFGAGGLQCTPDRCQKCKDSFEESILTYDCAGKCGLCALCLGSPNNVPDCERWCKVSEESCTQNCNQGKQICISCSAACGVF